MSLWEEVQPWIDKEYGLMQAGDYGRDNLILMSSYLYRELLNNNEVEAAATLFGRCMKFLTLTNVSPGLYRKLPGSTDNNTEDNMIGNCYVSQIAAVRIWIRWKRRLSCFDVNSPNKIALNNNFFARFFGLKAYIMASSGYKPWFVQRIIWCVSVFFTVKTAKGASDSLKLMLQCDKMIRWCPKAVKYWYKHNSIPALYSEYFGPNHPITKYSLLNGGV